MHALTIVRPVDYSDCSKHSHDADLLVTGTHGFSGARTLLFGSTLQSMLRRARIPVLAVPLVDHQGAAVPAEAGRER